MSMVDDYSYDLRIVAYAAAFLIALYTFKKSGIIRYVSNDTIGVAEKLWSGRGSIKSGLIALRGEAGYQPDVLRGGLHFFPPFLYRIHHAPLVTVGQGKIGYVFARDGRQLQPSQTLASNAETRNFEDVRDFLARGGQKGPQRSVLREGTYAINLAQFVVLMDDRIHALALSEGERATIARMADEIAERHGFEPVIIRGAEDQIGIVTLHDGPPLPAGEIIAPVVGGDDPADPHYHNSFQDPERVIAAGGHRGRQLQVLADGTYFLNRLFATVELVAKTVIDVGYVGVVVSYTGDHGEDLSGAKYRHGELVATGHRGVWAEPLLPGKYAFNTYAGHVIQVPTTNFVLKWTKGVVGGHKLDENLSEIDLITQDAFEPALPLSVVVHIDYQKAPQVIQRFGDVRKLVEQTLDPMVSAYFKDIGQRKTLIELLQERADIQKQAGEEMRARFAAYSLDLQEVLIGTPRAANGDKSIETILAQLRERQIAVEQVETYRLQEASAVQQRTLKEAEAAASSQTLLTQSQIRIRINENEGAADLARSQKDAERVRVTAQAQSDKLRLEGDGEAARVAAIGAANATATKAQVDAYGGPEFRLAEQVASRLFEAVAQGKQPIVPATLVISGDDSAQTGLLSGLLTSFLPGGAMMRLADGKSAVPPNGAGHH